MSSQTESKVPIKEKEPNQVIGYWTCQEGGKAEVFQTKKRGRHFYTRCTCCGFQQGTGANRQQKIYDEAEFLSGVTVVKPSNVNDREDFNERKLPNFPCLRMTDCIDMTVVSYSHLIRIRTYMFLCMHACHAQWNCPNEPELWLFNRY